MLASAQTTLMIFILLMDTESYTILLAYKVKINIEAPL